MSLINDALRRVRRKPQDPPASAGSSEDPLLPVEAAPAKRRSAVVILSGSVLILVLAAWFLWQWWSSSGSTQVADSRSATTNQTQAAGKSSIASNLTQPFQAVAKLDAALKEARQTNAEVNTNAPSPPASATSVVAPPIEQVSAGSPVPPTSVTSLAETNATSANRTAEAPANDLPPPVVARNVTFPPLKIQGIFFRLSKPSVLINNRTLFLGDEVDGVRVVGIERSSVKVRFKGATNDLFLK